MFFVSTCGSLRSYCLVKPIIYGNDTLIFITPQSLKVEKTVVFHKALDLLFALKNCKVTMYADDTSISYSFKSIEDLTETLNNELKCLKEWLQGNKLSLNEIKTQAMVIGSRSNLKKIGETLWSLLHSLSMIPLKNSSTVLSILESKLTNTSCGTSKLICSSQSLPLVRFFKICKEIVAKNCTLQII